uniref:Ig-like domain-containing protein n=1 Tax=Pyxicephalus adspersus TaxID=30357 RepID=A0AAV2ZSE2_PYXAD|nr:TPA: hypothetical protein GDO54_004069 [Pyxicephalus adspersus]
MSQSVKVTQDKFIIVQSGKSAELKCQHGQTDWFDMFWYQQKAQQGLKLMVHSTNAGDNSKMEEGFGSWTLSRTHVVNSTLKLSQASSEDSAIYFCAIRDHS